MKIPDEPGDAWLRASAREACTCGRRTRGRYVLREVDGALDISPLCPACWTAQTRRPALRLLSGSNDSAAPAA